LFVLLPDIFILHIASVPRY